MRFGMGEVFQFSSPYKWRCSKRFYRLFVYCSWLLIARDNSTGFTIVWGSASAGGGVWTTFARSFSSVLSVAFAPWDSGNYSWGNNLNNSGFLIIPRAVVSTLLSDLAKANGDPSPFESTNGRSRIPAVIP